MIIDTSEFLVRARLDRATLEVWVAEEWLIPSGAADELVFSEADLARARLIDDLIQDLGVNDDGIGIILNLVDQVHSLRRVLMGALEVISENSIQSSAGFFLRDE